MVVEEIESNLKFTFLNIIVRTNSKILVIPGELSTYGKEVFDRLERDYRRKAFFDGRYFARLGKELSSEKSDEHRVSYSDLKDVDQFRGKKKCQYALILNDSLYTCEFDVEAIIRGRLGVWIEEDKPFVLWGSDSISDDLYSYANSWNVYHNKLCRVGIHAPPETRTIRVELDVVNAKPPINVEDGVEFSRSLIDFLSVPYRYEPEKYFSILRARTNPELLDIPAGGEITPQELARAYQEIRNPPFNKIKSVQNFLKHLKPRI